MSNGVLDLGTVQMYDLDEICPSIADLRTAIARLHETRSASEAKSVCAASRRSWSLFVPVFEQFEIDEKIGHELANLLMEAHDLVQNGIEATPFTRRYASNIRRRAETLRAILNREPRKFRAILREAMRTSEQQPV